MILPFYLIFLLLKSSACWCTTALPLPEITPCDGIDCPLASASPSPLSSSSTSSLENLSGPQRDTIKESFVVSKPDQASQYDRESLTNADFLIQAGKNKGVNDPEDSYVFVDNDQLPFPEQEKASIATSFLKELAKQVEIIDDHHRFKRKNSRTDGAEGSRRQPRIEEVEGYGPLSPQMIVSLAQLIDQVYAASNRNSIDVKTEETGLTLRSVFAINPKPLPELKEDDLVVIVEAKGYCIVAFRGSVNTPNWISNFDARWTRFTKRTTGETIALTHKGMTKTYSVLRPLNGSFMRELRDCVSERGTDSGSRERKLIITGHSRGGGLASIMALDVASDESWDLNEKGEKAWDMSRFRAPNAGNLLVYTFGEPRTLSVGFRVFSWQSLTSHIVKHRFTHPLDVVSHIPPLPYVHWGEKHTLTVKNPIDYVQVPFDSADLATVLLIIAQKMHSHSPFNYLKLLKDNLLESQHETQNFLNWSTFEVKSRTDKQNLKREVISSLFKHTVEKKAARASFRAVNPSSSSPQEDESILRANVMEGHLESVGATSLSSSNLKAGAGNYPSAGSQQKRSVASSGNNLIL